jgi:hypothetical protein
LGSYRVSEAAPNLELNLGLAIAGAIWSNSAAYWQSLRPRVLRETEHNLELSMLTARDQYSIRSFDRRSVNTTAFDKAINIYRDTVGGRAKTDASQIVYWTERSSAEFSKNGSQVHVLGLIRERAIIGFALCFYASDQKLFLIDHLAITPTARSMTAFECFCDLIARYAKDEHLDVDYFVTEVSVDLNDTDPILNADTLIRLLQIKGLRVVDCQYMTPTPEKRPPYLAVKAKLLLYSSTENRIETAKLLRIVSCLHDDVYKNWYKPFADDYEAYCVHLQAIRTLIQRGVGNKEAVAMNGHPPAHTDKNIIDAPPKTIVILFFICAAGLFSIAIAYGISLLNIGFSSALAGAITLSIFIVAILSIWSDRASLLVKHAIDALFSVFGRRK